MDTASAPTTITTDYLMTLHAPGAPSQMVDDSLAIYSIRADGWVRGPRLTGRIVQPTADWLRRLPGGSLRLDARMTIRSDDDAIIHVAYGGVIGMTPALFARLEQGETLTSADLYFITAPTFQTAAPAHAWLNQIQAIGKLAGLKFGPDGYVRYDVFAVR